LKLYHPPRRLLPLYSESPTLLGRFDCIEIQHAKMYSAWIDGQDSLRCQILG